MDKILKASFGEKINYVSHAIIWYGLYLIFSGILKILGLDSKTRQMKKFKKSLNNLEYRV